MQFRFFLLLFSSFSTLHLSVIHIENLLFRAHFLKVQKLARKIIIILIQIISKVNFSRQNKALVHIKEKNQKLPCNKMSTYLGFMTRRLHRIH